MKEFHNIKQKRMSALQEKSSEAFSNIKQQNNTTFKQFQHLMVPSIFQKIEKLNFLEKEFEDEKTMEKKIINHNQKVYSQNEDKIHIKDSLTDISLEEEVHVLSFKKKKKIAFFSNQSRQEEETQKNWHIESTECGDEKKYAKYLMQNKDASNKFSTKGDSQIWDDISLNKEFQKDEIICSKSSIEHRMEAYGNEIKNYHEEDFGNLQSIEFVNDSDSQQYDDDDQDLRCYLPRVCISQKDQMVNLTKSIGGYKSEYHLEDGEDRQIDWNDEEISSFQ